MIYITTSRIQYFSLHKRGGVGIKAAVVTAKTGPIISVKTIHQDDVEALLVSTQGQTIRVSLKDIPLLGRTTQGVRIMKTSDDDSVASVGLMSERSSNEES